MVKKLQREGSFNRLFFNNFRFLLRIFTTLQKKKHLKATLRITIS